MKWLIGIVLLLLAIAAYWNFRVYQKTQYLLEFSKPFQAACQTNSGCVLSPEGWDKSGGTVYYKDFMEYTADKDKFEIRWHIATDAFLVAKGGKGKEVTVEHTVE